jgi:hypothetical protein
MCPTPRTRRRPGRRGFAGQRIQDITGTASVATGHPRPAPTATRPQRCMIIAPRTIRLCLQRRQRPDGFWASHTTGQTARRPQCLSRCQALNPGRYPVIGFDGLGGRGRCR